MRAEASDIYAQATAQWLAVYLLTSNSRALNPGDGRQPGILTDPRLARAVAYIEGNLGTSINLDAIASEAGVSKFHFIKLFRQKLGASPIRYLFSKRLEMAAEMLENSSLTVKQIALHCGFLSVNHFTVAFVKKFGKAPTFYR